MCHQGCQHPVGEAVLILQAQMVCCKVSRTSPAIQPLRKAAGTVLYREASGSSLYSSMPGGQQHRNNRQAK
jgi:hypothetical protein